MQALSWLHPQEEIRFSRLERVGCPGLFCGGEKGEGGGEGAWHLGRAGLFLGWGGAGLTDPAVRVC